MFFSHLLVPKFRNMLDIPHQSWSIPVGISSSEISIHRQSYLKLESVVNLHAADGHDASSHHHRHSSDGSGRGAGIGRLLGQYGVQVMVSRAFGPNIKRMRQRFVPVKIDADRLTTAVALLQSHWDRVQSCWLEGEGRKHLVLRSTS